MRSYHLQSLGALDGLVLRTDGERAIAPHEVRVRMHAVSLNFRDVLIALDKVPLGGTRDDVVPLSDGAGVVVEVGSAVTRVAVGERVAAVFCPQWIDGPARQDYLAGALGGARDGTLAETVILDGNGVVALPDHLSFEEGAAHGCASVTAWSSLMGGQPLRAGQSVLVQGTGGVSLFALQFAKAAGAYVIATTSSAKKAERLRALGADAVVNYVEKPDWHEPVRALTNGKGVDRVVEVGGPGTLTQSVQATAVGGHIAVVGFTGGAEGAFSPLMLIGKCINLEGIAVGSRRSFLDSLQLTRQADLHPVIDRVFRFEEARAAYQHMLERRHVGKIVISIQ